MRSFSRRFRGPQSTRELLASFAGTGAGRPKDATGPRHRIAASSRFPAIDPVAARAAALRRPVRFFRRRAWPCRLITWGSCGPAARTQPGGILRVAARLRLWLRRRHAGRRSAARGSRRENAVAWYGFAGAEVSVFAVADVCRGVFFIPPELAFTDRFARRRASVFHWVRRRPVARRACRTWTRARVARWRQRARRSTWCPGHDAAHRAASAGIASRRGNAR